MRCRVLQSLEIFLLLRHKGFQNKFIQFKHKRETFYFPVFKYIFCKKEKCVRCTLYKKLITYSLKISVHALITNTYYHHNLKIVT